ncbi:MAG: transcription termination factor Rho [Coriobacteriia bacterium]|nr:transcription termination factor Rho [Coriobacteriia bacterium]
MSEDITPPTKEIKRPKRTYTRRNRAIEIKAEGTQADNSQAQTEEAQAQEAPKPKRGRPRKTQASSEGEALSQDSKNAKEFAAQTGAAQESSSEDSSEKSEAKQSHDESSNAKDESKRSEHKETRVKRSHSQRSSSSQNSSHSSNNQNSNTSSSYNSQNNRRRRSQEPVSPKLSKEELAKFKVTELKVMAQELELNTSELRKKADLIDAIYLESAKQEGFEDVEGILDILPEGYGFLRRDGYLPSENDIYVAAAFIRRNGLRKGDYVVGVNRPSQGNEKYPAMHKINSVNGMDLESLRNRPKFGDLTPIYPNERLVQEHGKNSLTGRCIDLVAPIGKGQRGLIVSPPKAGKTTILKKIAESIAANNPEVHLMCLLVDERPEEVTDMRRSIKGEVIASTFDMPSDQHIAVSELVIERAKRLVESGGDVVILLDSITRLARAYNLAQPASGRILSGGVDSTALYPPKRFLGAARNIEHGGSLTILASALIDTGSKMDEVIFEEFKGTGNMELKLDRDLADRRIFPSIDPVASGTRKEELLLDPQIQPFVWGIRRVLANMNNVERAMSMLIKSLTQTNNNEEFLLRSAKKAQENNNYAEL